jgi:hypothetical protein
MAKSQIDHLLEQVGLAICTASTGTRTAQWGCPPEVVEELKALEASLQTTQALFDAACSRLVALRTKGGENGQ